MSMEANTNVEMFGMLHTFRRMQGLEPNIKVEIPPEGSTAYDLARDLGLPLKKVEAVFINNVAHSLNYIIQPGDSVAFIPTGIPGSMRIQLDIFNADLKKAA